MDPSRRVNTLNDWICLNLYCLLLCFISCQKLVCAAENFLTVNGVDLMFNNEKVFLSGMNQAWWHYGNDFGNNGYNSSKPHLIKTLDDIHSSGGNSIRVWVHITGGNTPQFNASGYVIGPGVNLTRDLQDFVHEAQRRNILVTLTLWNCAALSGNEPMLTLMDNVTLLESYLSNALVPIVRALADNNAMAIWEVINEPEGCMLTGHVDKEEPCYDTSTLHWYDFADWTREKIPLKILLPFIAAHARTIHQTDPKALVTVGSWTYRTITDQLGRRNFYSDHCMKAAAGGDVRARLDLYQIHTYDTLFFYLPNDPFLNNADIYKSNKPLIIGEFSQKKGGQMTSAQQFTWAYYHGYSGAWSWCALAGDDASDSVEVQKTGMRSLRNKNDQNNGGRVNITLTAAEHLNHGLAWDRMYKRFRTVVMVIFDVIWQRYSV